MEAQDAYHVSLMALVNSYLRPEEDVTTVPADLILRAIQLALAYKTLDRYFVVNEITAAVMQLRKNYGMYKREDNGIWRAVVEESVALLCDTKTWSKKGMIRVFCCIGRGLDASMIAANQLTLLTATTEEEMYRVEDRNNAIRHRIKTQLYIEFPITDERSLITAIHMIARAVVLIQFAARHLPGAEKKAIVMDLATYLIEIQSQGMSPERRQLLLSILPLFVNNWLDVLVTLGRKVRRKCFLRCCPSYQGMLQDTVLSAAQIAGASVTAVEPHVTQNAASPPRLGTKDVETPAPLPALVEEEWQSLRADQDYRSAVSSSVPAYNAHPRSGIVLPAPKHQRSPIDHLPTRAAVLPTYVDPTDHHVTASLPQSLRVRRMVAIEDLPSLEKEV